MIKNKKPGSKRKLGGAFHKNNMTLLLFCLPAILLTFVFGYLPMGGIWMAFTEFRFDLGLFSRPFVGLDNFWIFQTPVMFRIIRNTIGYGLGLMLIGHVTAIILALLLYEIRSKKALKFYQTAYTIPNYMSWIIISYLTYIFLSPTNGLINSFLELIGSDRVNLFTRPMAWIIIIPIVSIWNGVGLQSILYYAALMGVDPELYDAAKVDGANRLKQIRYISLPSIMPTFTILVILGMRNILRGDFGLFYAVTRNVGLLYPTTDILDTYIFRGLRAGNFGATTAVGLVQSVVGMFVILIVNAVVKKLSPGSELF